MKIIIIQQASSAMTWDAKYDSASFENAIAAEHSCGIAPVSVRQTDASAYRIYTGTSRASVETAAALFTFSENEEEQTPLLDDVPLRAFRDTENAYSVPFWKAMAKAQWYTGNKRQTETRAETLRRAGEFVDHLENEEKDCVLVTDALVRNALLSILSRRGYCIEGERRPKPLARVRATKRSLHCGGCMHNCLLSDPGCAIGKDKARRESSYKK